MHEAATLADRVGIMDHGHLLALDTPEALMRSLPGRPTLELTTTAAVQDGEHAAMRLVGALASAGRSVERAEPLADDGAGARRRPARAALRLRRGAAARRAGGRRCSRNAGCR